MCVFPFQSQSFHCHPPGSQEKKRDPEKWGVTSVHAFKYDFLFIIVFYVGLMVVWCLIGWAEAEAELAALEELRLSRAMAYVSINPSSVGETRTHTRKGTCVTFSMFSVMCFLCVCVNRWLYESGGSTVEAATGNDASQEETEAGLITYSSFAFTFYISSIQLN